MDIIIIILETFILRMYVPTHVGHIGQSVTLSCQIENYLHAGMWFTKKTLASLNRHCKKYNKLCFYLNGEWCDHIIIGIGTIFLE